MGDWRVEKIVHFGPGDLIKDGSVHFGFHGKSGRQFALQHQKHFLGPVNEDGVLEWTLAPAEVFDGIQNIEADISYPIYIDEMADGTLVVSCFGNSRLYRVDEAKMEARVFVDGMSLGMKHAGNCVVDDEGFVWVNEVDGCRVWRFDAGGKPVLVLGDGIAGYQSGIAKFNEVRFNWIYDMRKGPDGNIYVLDSGNFALRVVDPADGVVRTLAGTGRGGYEGDGGEARLASFESDPTARFDGPISLSLDESGNIYVGDRFNHVVRMIHSGSGIVETIAGSRMTKDGAGNAPGNDDPLRLNLPKISSMDYHGGRLFVPTDLTDETGDLAVLKRRRLA